MANNTVISLGDYTTIATLFSTARDSVRSAVSNFYDAVQAIVVLDVVEPSIDLLPQFYATYLSVASDLKSDARYLPAVRTINSHVFHRGVTQNCPVADVGLPYASITAFLEDTDVNALGGCNNAGGNVGTVPQGWADLCALTGEIIDPAVIL